MHERVAHIRLQHARNRKAVVPRPYVITEHPCLVVLADGASSLVICQSPAQHGLHLTPLARPVTWCIFYTCGVPSLVSLHTPASGAGEAQRWAALNPKRPCRTIKRTVAPLWTNLLTLRSTNIRIEHLYDAYYACGAA